MHIAGKAIFFLLLAGLLPSCAQHSVLYLEPNREGTVPPSVSGPAVVQLQAFEEEFAAQETVGGHYFRTSQQILKIRSGQVSRTLVRLLAAELAGRSIPFRLDGNWDQTPEGLAGATPPVRLVIDGRIRRLWLEVRSGLTHTSYDLDLMIDGAIGAVPERKVLNQKVHITQEVIKFSSQPEVMEEILQQNLAEAARQMAARIEEII